VAAFDVPAVREVLDGRIALKAVGDLAGLIVAAESAARPAPPPLSYTWDDAAHATWDVYREATREPARPRLAGQRRRP
jgi:hypothetical protein